MEKKSKTFINQDTHTEKPYDYQMNVRHIVPNTILHTMYLMLERGRVHKYIEYFYFL